MANSKDLGITEEEYLRRLKVGAVIKFDTDLITQENDERMALLRHLKLTDGDVAVLAERSLQTR